MTDIGKARILIMATDGFEQSELLVPLKSLKEKGAMVEVASPEKTLEPGRIRAWDGGRDYPDWGERVDVDKTLGEVEIDDYDALVIPGGVINPDHLRIDDKAVDLVRRFFDSGKVVAAVCHGPWLLVEAGVVKGRRVTSYKTIRTDVRNAGGNWVDETVVADQGLVTSRNPGDLGAFVDKIVEEVREGRHDRRAA